MSQEWLLRPVAFPVAPHSDVPVRKAAAPSKASPATTPFQAELNKKLSTPKVTFSNHALERLRVRNIRLTQDDLNRLGSAIDKVAAKGGRESLVLYNDTAYVINVKNRTVITAVDTARMRDHVFTQIDSAVFA